MRKLQGAGNRASGEINHTHDPHENNHMSPQNGCHTVPLIDDWSCQWLIRSALSLSFARILQPLEVCCVFPCKLCNSKKFFILNTRMIRLKYNFSATPFPVFLAQKWQKHTLLWRFQWLSNCLGLLKSWQQLKKMENTIFSDLCGLEITLTATAHPRSLLQHCCSYACLRIQRSNGLPDPEPTITPPIPRILVTGLDESNLSEWLEFLDLAMQVLTQWKRNGRPRSRGQKKWGSRRVVSWAPGTFFFSFFILLY